MNRYLCASIGLLIPLVFHENLIADIAFAPSEPAPWDEQLASPSQSSTTIAGTALIICAVVATLIVRVKKARQSKPENSTGASGTSGASGQR